MRDDVTAGVHELCRLLDKKKTLLHRLLLNGSDKIHYVKSENPERVSAILLEDDSIIDEINLIDCDIASNEDSLLQIIGVHRKDLYNILQKSGGNVQELITRRKEIRELLDRLLFEHNRLIETMASATREVSEHIEDIARIRKLKLPEAE